MISTDQNLTKSCNNLPYLLTLHLKFNNISTMIGNEFVTLINAPVSTKENNHLD